MSRTSKHLAIFVPDLVVGGAERSMLKLAGGIADRGYSVDLVLSRAIGPFLSEVPASVSLVDLKARRVLASLPALVRYLSLEKPYVMLSVLHANLIALWAKRIANVPTRILVSERNTLSMETQNFNADFRMRLMPFLVRRYYPWADGIVAVSKGVADDLIRVAGLPRNCIQVIYNPIVTPELQVKAQTPLEHPWFGPGESPVILAVGRLTAQKDYSTLIQAFAQVHMARPARLLILGEGEERARLEGLVEQLGVSPDVSLPGFIPNPYPFMARAAAFVLSSKWEGLPGVLIEAMYCGAPLVATDCPSGPREILLDGRYGRLVPVGDTNAMANAISEALENKIPPPPEESWQPFEQEFVVNQYLDALLGIPLRGL